MGLRPLAFDTLRACSANTSSIIETFASTIAHRSHCAYSIVNLSLRQRLSYAIWSSVATQVLARMPSHVTDPQYPVKA